MRINQSGEMSRWFLRTCWLVLAITGGAKLVSLTSGAKIFTVADPITGLPFKYLMLGVGIIESIIAVACFLHWQPKLTLSAVTWLSACFLTYRVGLWLIAWHRPCPCLGNLTDVLHLSPGTADIIARSSALYLFIGSCIMLWLENRRQRLNGEQS